MNQFSKGVLLTYINIALTNVLGIFVTPYIINNLGDNQYGLYTYVVTVFAYLAILDFGLSHTVLRFVSVLKIKNNKIDETKFLATAFTIGLVLSGLMAIIGVVLISNLNYFLSINFNEEMLNQLKIMLSILILNLMVSIPGNIFVAINNAYEQFVFPRIINIISYITRVAILFIILYFDKNPVKLVILDASISISVVILNYLYVTKKIKINIQIGFFDKSLVQKILIYSFWIFLFNLVNRSQWLFGQFILGKTTDAKTVGYYNIGVMLGSYYTAFAYAINEMLIPRASRTLNSNEVTVTEDMIKISRLLLYIMFIILFCFGFFGEKFIFLWLPNNNGIFEIWLTAFLIMFFITFSMLYFYGFSILQIKNKMKKFSIINFIIMYLAFLIGYFLSKEYQIIGMIGAIVSAIFISTIFTLFYFKYTIELDLKKYLYKIYFKNLDLFLILIAIGYILNKYLITLSWINLFFKIITCVAFYLIYLFCFKLEKTEKDYIITIKNKIF